MLRLGVIKPSTRSWHSPIVLVPKPDGSIRFCFDFREVNKMASFDAYPMSWADVLLNQLGEATYMGALDLTKGYWQIPLRPQDKEKTDYATPKGLFHFTSMPFGLHRVVTTFQCLVDTVLSPYKNFTLAYLDDIVIYCRTLEEQVQHLRQVFQQLHKAGHQVNPKKRKAGIKELVYLGYTVGEGQLKPQKSKVDTIATVARPSSKRQLCKCLGLVGYYSHFIQDFATHAAPLIDRLAMRSPDTLQWDPLQCRHLKYSGRS